MYSNIDFSNKKIIFIFSIQKIKFEVQIMGFLVMRNIRDG